MPMVPLSFEDIERAARHLVADDTCGPEESAKDAELAARLRQHAATERKVIEDRAAARAAEQAMSLKRRTEAARRAWRCDNDHPAGADDRDVEAHAARCGFEPYDVPGYPEEMDKETTA